MKVKNFKNAAFRLKLLSSDENKKWTWIYDENRGWSYAVYPRDAIK